MSYEDFLDDSANSITDFWRDHKVGILCTIIFHLLLLVILLACKLHTVNEYYGSEIDVEFEEEQIEDEIPEPEKQLLPADALVPEYESEAIRNFAVDANDVKLNANLSDEKNIDAQELYNNWEQQKQQMLQNKEEYEEIQNIDEIPNTPEKEVPEEKKVQIKGATVISYFLEGWKGVNLPNPAYKCEKGGQVVVNIEVKPNGQVSKASIDKKLSVIDDCINSEALVAAERSRFTPKNDGSKQSLKGSITYFFVAQ